MEQGIAESYGAGVPEDEINKRADEVVGEYVSMRAALEIEIMESLLMKLETLEGKARR